MPSPRHHRYFPRHRTRPAQLRHHRTGHDFEADRSQARRIARIHRGGRWYLQVQGAPPRNREPHASHQGEPRAPHRPARRDGPPAPASRAPGPGCRALHRAEERRAPAESAVADAAVQQLDREVQQRERRISELEVKLEAVIAEQRSMDAAIETSRDNQTELNDRFNEVQGRYYSLGADVARAEQSIHHQQDRARKLREDLLRAERDLNDAREHLATDAQKQEQWRVELETIQPELELIEARAEESTEQLLAAEQAMQEWQQQWEDFNHSAATPRQQAE